MSHTERVVLLIDMDCFYCQVEEKLNPGLQGKPLAVVQYNAWRGGGIIAVNYPARSRGVTRHMRGDEAKRKCPEITLVRVPTIREKADLSKYRDAGKIVAKVLQSFTPLLERASVDEAYLDITNLVKARMEASVRTQIKPGDIANTHVVAGDKLDYLYNLYESGLYSECNLKLAYGAAITEEIRAAVFEQMGYTCSAGIAHNKILAKLACGLNKPNKQTILPHDAVGELYKKLPVNKIRSLGGKFGETLSGDLGITYMSELEKFSERQLQARYDGKTGTWLYEIARGINRDPVTARLASKSIGCCKKFAGKSALVEPASVQHWLGELAGEIAERLEQDSEENNRKAKQMVVSFSHEDTAGSRVHPLNSYDPQKIAQTAYEVVKKNCMKQSGTFCLKYLGISAGKFEDCRKSGDITSFFKPATSRAEITEGSKEAEFVQETGDEFERLVSLGQSMVEPKLEETNLNATYVKHGDFSDTTEELEEDEARLNFYNEPEQDSCDSIGNELPDEKPKQQSFFQRYFDSIKDAHDGSPRRDFDTSLALDELEENHESNYDQEAEDVEEPTETCPECGQVIKQTELTSHSDHHFAMKLVEEESRRDRAKTVQVNRKDVEKAGKKAQKRKHADLEKGNRSLTSFFKSQTDLCEDGEVCPECSKKINPELFQNHLDYHVAKKLHLELNPVKTCSSVNPTKSSVPLKSRTKTVNPLGAFLKPST